MKGDFVHKNHKQLKTNYLYFATNCLINIFLKLMLIIKYFFIHLSKKTINMYNYEQHFIDMVSNCCGDSMEELQEFCYVCDTRTKNEVIDGVAHCDTCKEERDFIDKYVCNCCDDICQPIEDYEYDQLRRDELKEMQYDCRT